MDAQKISHFLQDNPGESYPYFRAIEGDELVGIRRSLAAVLGIPPGSSLDDIAVAILPRMLPVPGLKADTGAFDIRIVIPEHIANGNCMVYLDFSFGDFGDGGVDCMAAAEVIKHFDSIWYWGPDDLLIYDESFGWIIWVDHNGYVYTLDGGNGRSSVDLPRNELPT